MGVRVKEWVIPAYIFTHGVQDWLVWNLFKDFKRGQLGGMSELALYAENKKYAEDYWWYFTIGFDQLLHVGILTYLVLLT